MLNYRSPWLQRSRMHVVEPPRRKSFIWQIGVNSSIQDQCQSIEVFMESSQKYAATLTHYSTEPHVPSPPPSTTHTSTMSDRTFNIPHWNANGIGNNQTELSIFLEVHSVKVAATQDPSSRHNREVPTSRTTP